MLYGASDIINLTHHVVMTKANEKLGSAPELLLGLSGIGQNQAIDAATVLVKPIDNLAIRACLRINMQSPEQPPMAAQQRRSGQCVKLLPELCC
jgi:hypothetical protein